ncbi:hypothetical protein DMA15_03665 [Streptomyces sp. WAC 01529]|uniref:hypothetical protein n=1 Tax=Streptomyces sp. WAC 01529 TaxID=2203205 RepID=UPI000F6C6F0E|nr:hypothetical protein [Streptomyces sp. WAC 01529]AZM51791.1 hypothetical protein DMA15_03665 [Streptomyces sp. WAC 01529]
MTKYTVPLSGYASATVTVETDSTDPEKILDLAYEEGVPGICAQCSGWGRDHSLGLGDEWEPVTDPKTKTAIVYDESGQPVQAPGDDEEEGDEE